MVNLLKTQVLWKKLNFPLKRKGKLKKEKRINNVNISLVCSLYYILFGTITLGNSGH